MIGACCHGIMMRQKSCFSTTHRNKSQEHAALSPEVHVVGKPYLKVVVPFMMDTVRFDNILI